MEGMGDLTGAETPHPKVRVFGMNGRWSRAAEPLHWLLDSPDHVHWWGMTKAQRDRALPSSRRNRTRGAGLGLTFAKRLVEATGVPVGLIPCAHGGTNMDQWDPAKRGEGGASLYGSLLRSVRAAGGRIAGVLWYQGESEGFETTPSPFLPRFLALVAALRKDVGPADLPFLYVQIGRVVDAWGIPPSRWSQIRELQRQALTKLRHAAMVTAIDLPLDDAIHVATPGLKLLGERLAKQALRLRFGRMRPRPGPTLERARVEGKGRALVRVTFGGVNGRLLPAFRVGGFSVRDAAEKDLLLVYEALPDPRRPADVLVRLRDRLPARATLWHGWGLDPFCHLADAEGLAAPAFGPIPL